MRRFDYKAKDKETGKMIKGSIQAENEQTAGKLLVEQGYIPETVVEHGDGPLSSGKRVTAKVLLSLGRWLPWLAPVYRLLFRYALWPNKPMAS